MRYTNPRLLYFTLLIKYCKQSWMLHVVNSNDHRTIIEKAKSGVWVMGNYPIFVGKQTPKIV